MLDTSSPRALVAPLFLATGAALLIYIISGISLLIALLVTLLGGILVGASVWRRTTQPEQDQLRRVLRAGVIAGLLGTAAYDLSRFILIEVTSISFWPFDIFTIFGQALVGAGYTGLWVKLAGVAFHAANGIGFALTYTLVLGERGVWAGITWAFVLELLMVSVYPGWLELEALNEFLQVSVVGHVVYGAVLGYSAKYLLEREDRAPYVTNE